MFTRSIRNYVHFADKRYLIMIGQTCLLFFTTMFIITKINLVNHKAKNLKTKAYFLHIKS